MIAPFHQLLLVTIPIIESNSGKSRIRSLYVIELSLSNCSNAKFSDLVVLSASFGLQITIVLLRDKGMLGYPRKISYVGSIRLAN